MAQPVRPASSEPDGVWAFEADDLIRRRSAHSMMAGVDYPPLAQRPDICMRLFPAATIVESSCVPVGSIYDPILRPIGCLKS